MWRKWIKYEQCITVRMASFFDTLEGLLRPEPIEGRFEFFVGWIWEAEKIGLFNPKKDWYVTMDLAQCI